MNSSSKVPCHLILARSSLQLMLAVALAEDTLRQGGETHLLFLPDVRDVAVFSESLLHWQDSPFASVELLTLLRSSEHRSVWKRNWPALRRVLFQRLAARNFTTVSVFNDREESGQALLLEAARRYPQVHRQCVEDGAQAYSGFTYRTHHWMTRWRQKLQNGWAWQDVTVLGTHPLIQAFLAIYPESVRPEISRDRIRAFPVSMLRAPRLQSFASAMCQRSGWETHGLPERPVLLALNHSDYARRNSCYAAEVAGLVNEARKLGLPLFFKYHPREKETDYLDLVPALGPTRELPRALPTECVYLRNADRPMMVMGGISTALLMARLLMGPETHVVSMPCRSSSGDAWPTALLNALKIESVRDADTLRQSLLQWRNAPQAEVLSPA